MWAVIATGGIESVSLRSVAGQAQVSVGRIQHYFASKDELLQHGCEVMLGDARAQFDAQIADTRSVLNFGMGANNLTVSGEFQDAGVVRFKVPLHAAFSLTTVPMS